MYVAYVYYGMRTTGSYFDPIPGLPNFAIGPQTGLGTIPSFAIALVTALLLGAIMHFLILRQLNRAPVLAKVVATVGLMLLLQDAAAYRYGTQPVSPPEFLPQGTLFTIGGVQVPVDQILLVAVAAAMGLVLWLLFRFSRFGVSTRAAAENEKGAVLLGFSPDRLAGLNWLLAALVAGAGGVFAAPITSLTPTGFTSMLLVPGLAAALLGRFSSIPVTIIAGILIGVVQSELLNLPAQLSWFPSTGTQDAFPFVLIVIVLLATGTKLPKRGALTLGRLSSIPDAPKRVAAPAAGLVVVLVPIIFFVSAGYRLALVNTLIGAILCLSLVVLTGYLGQISLFQLTISGIAAYATVGLSSGWHVPFPIAPLLAAMVGMLVGMLAAIPALRIRGVNLAVITLAFAAAVTAFFFDNPDYTGGPNGATASKPTIFGLDFSFNNGQTVAQPSFGVLCVVVLAVLAMIVANVRRGATGRRMLAVRANERAAASCGVDVSKTKIIGFALSALIAGMAGALMAYQQGILTSSSFDALLSVALLATAYLGGITSIAGALVGGILTTGGVLFYTFETYVFSDTPSVVNVEQMILALGLIVSAILNPEGIVGAVTQFTRKFVLLRHGLPDAPPEVNASASTSAAQPASPAPSDKTAGSLALGAASTTATDGS